MASIWEKGFKEELESGFLSDLTLQLPETTFQVHKLILCKSSHYFKNLITNNPQITSIYLEQEPSTLSIILEYLYTGNIKTNIVPDNVLSLQEAAHFYGIPGLSNELFQVLEAEFRSHPESIFRFLKYANSKKIYDYMKANFMSIYATGCFSRVDLKDFSPKELYTLLLEDEIEVENEQVVYNVISSYIQNNLSFIGPEEIRSLLSIIKFDYIDAQSMLDLYLHFKDYLPTQWKYSIISRICDHSKIPCPKEVTRLEPRPSYAKLVAKNLLVHHSCGGSLKLVQYAFINGAGDYNGGTLEEMPTASWGNNGCFMDDPLTSGSPLLSYRPNSATGSTWRNSDVGGHGAGILVADVTQVPEMTITFHRFTIFQMVSDGATTGIRILRHPSLIGVPQYDDQGWVEVLPLSPVGQASVVPNPPGGSSSGNTVACTNEYVVESFRTRFLKIELFNDGSNGTPGYIELRQIKGYAI